MAMEWQTNNCSVQSVYWVLEWLANGSPTGSNLFPVFLSNGITIASNGSPMALCGCLIGVLNFEGNEDKNPTNENASKNGLSGTKEHHEEETPAPAVNPNIEMKVTGS